MSQLYRLCDFYDTNTVDVITSTINYLCQGLGMFVYSYGLKKNIELFKKKKTYIITLIIGSLFMIIMQLVNNGLIILMSGIIYNLLIGIYFGYYLTMMAQNIPFNSLGLSYGISYAFGSVGTYVLSIIDDGNYLVSKNITIIYLLLAILTIVIVYYCDNVTCNSDNNYPKLEIKSLIPILLLMSIISTVGSGLYLSLPIAESVDFNLIRVFYAIGLITAGIIFDKNRSIGNIVTLASLTYPLVATAITQRSEITTLALAISYVCIGFFSVYRVVTFMDIGNKNNSYLYLACLGLMISRIVEAIVTLFIIYVNIPEFIQLVISVLLFATLIILYYIFQDKKNKKENISNETKFNVFAEKYDLSQREIELFKYIYEGMSDKEISSKLFISTNTVRFHISNIMKKTSTSSRVEVVRLFINEF